MGSKQEGFFHSSPLSSVLDAFSFLLTFSQPRSSLAGQLSYIYYYLLFLSVKWKHFYLVIHSQHWSALSPCASLCSTLQGSHTLGARECRCSKAAQCLATPFLFEVTHNYHWFGSVTSLLHSLTSWQFFSRNGFPMFVMPSWRSKCHGYKKLWGLSHVH